LLISQYRDILKMLPIRQEGRNQTMRTIERLLRILHRDRSPISDPSFTAYYSALVSEAGSGVPTVEEARRDFEPVRRVIERAFIV